MLDAFNKADNIQAPYFFTWNVNTFVLFDRSKWKVPLIERRLKDWDLGFNLHSPGDCKRPDVHTYIRDKFLPELFEMLAAIVKGEIAEWGVPPDEVFIRSLESHLEWPVFGTRDYLIMTAAKDTAFSDKLQSWMAEEMNWTFDPGDSNNWSETLERAARTLCYIFSNRAIFYEAIRAKYPDDLNHLKMPRRGRNEQRGIYDYFRDQFKRAVAETGDYEPIFYPQVDDWAGALIFASDMACEGWTGLFKNLAQYNFREIPYDIIGGIFQKLISPEERQKFGQFYTNEDIIDIINAFCIRRAGDIAIDPACGSGSFLVRAYHRKAWLSEQKSGGRRHHDAGKSHQELLREIYGCDIALFAAHLATLNLASRHIEDEENYPYIARANFFEIPGHRDKFSVVPGLREANGEKDMIAVPLPDVDAVIGNPPYVRQEGIPKESELKRQKGETKEAYEARRKTTKDYLQELCKELWPGLKLSGRSDLHCYFWPVAASLLKEGGYFGFLTSSSWLDVDYGFALQGWILKGFKLIAVIESLDEPWFKDARVKTSITILQRCDDRIAGWTMSLNSSASLSRLKKFWATVRTATKPPVKTPLKRCAKSFFKPMRRFPTPRCVLFRSNSKNCGTKECAPAHCSRQRKWWNRNPRSRKKRKTMARRSRKRRRCIESAPIMWPANGDVSFVRPTFISDFFATIGMASCDWAKSPRSVLESRVVATIFSCRAM